MTSTPTTCFLVVDDDDDHAALIERSLRRNGENASILRARDGVEALAILRAEDEHGRRERPNAVLLDLNMPRMNGHELLAVIKEDPQLCTIPVVILSTSESEADRSLAYKNRANSYLVKPLDLLQFRDMCTMVSAYWGRWNQPAPA